MSVSIAGSYGHGVIVATIQSIQKSTTACRSGTPKRMHDPSATHYSVSSVGYIDVAYLDSAGLSVEGWSAAEGGSPPIDGFTAEVNGQEGLPWRVESQLESSDVAAVHPSLAGAARCRFRLRLGREAMDGFSSENLFVKVQPWSDGKPARALFHVAAPTLPKPPAKNLELVGGGFNVGFEFLGHLINEADLDEDAAVLDVGCGTGRIAYALAYYLSRESKYLGFDVVEELVEWPRQTITPRFPNFEFLRLDISNGSYNREGQLDAAQVDFPCDPASIDVAVSTSVITHMTMPGVRRYLSEFGRVLRPNGRCLITCFMVDEPARQAMAEGHGPLRLHAFAGGYTTNPDCPEEAIGFDEVLLSDWIADAGLRIRKRLPGWWSGRSGYLSYQDTLVLSPQ